MTVTTPKILSFSPDSGAATGNPNLVDQNILTLTGTAAANTSVEVFNGSTLLGSATTDSNGNWTFTTPTLGTGFFSVALSAVDVDSTGAKSAASSALNLTVDMLTPQTPTITSYSPATGTTGSGTTTATTLTLTGAASEVDGFVQVYDNGKLLGTATLNMSNNTWSFQTGTLATGVEHHFTATFTNWAGATSVVSSELDVAVVAPPATPTITSITPDTGAAGITDSATLTLAGTAGANVTVNIYDGGTLLGKTTTNANGAWTFATGTLASGAQNFTAVAVDSVGDVSQTSAIATMTIDTHTPAAPTVLTDTLSASNVLTLTGTSEANDTIKIYDGSTLIGETVANASGAWQFSPGTLANGTHNISATATDLAGAVSAASDDPVINVTSSTGVVLNTPTILSASPSSGSGSSLTSTSNLLTLTGEGDANTTVNVYDGATKLGVATVSAAGVWSFTTSTALTDGSHSFSAIETDASGDQSAQSSAFSITVKPDITSFSALTDQWSAPISVDGMPFYVENANVNGNAPYAITMTDPQTLRFQLDPGDTWSDNGSHRTEIGSSTIYAPTTTINTSYQFMVEPGPTNQYWTVLGQFHSDDNSSITQSLTADYPVFAVELTGKNASGQGDYIGIWADYTLPGQTTPTAITASGTSSWGMIYVSPTPIVRGQYYSVQIEASFQNNSSGFLEVWLNGTEIVNYHGPIGYGAGTYWKEGIYQDSSDTTQTIAADYKNLQLSDTPNAPLILTDTLNGGVATLVGTGEANSTITIYDGSTKLGTASVDSTGSWTYQTSAALSAGVHALTATVKDTAGNVSPTSNVFDVTVGGTSTSAAPTLTTFSPDTGTVGNGVTDAHTLTLSGAATANTTVTILDGSTVLGTTTANAIGAWSFATGQLATGAHQFTATDTNSSGVVSAASSVLTVNIVAAPSTPTVTSFSQDTGAVGDGVTDAHTLTLSGAATANTTVTVYDGATKLGTATANANGVWSFATGQLVTGAHQFTATDTDAYGDVSAASSGLNVTVVAAPTAPTVTSFSPDTGTVGDGVTDAHTLTLSGAAAANTTVTVYDGATKLGTATANASGVWSFATGQLATGAHQFTATDTDAYGDVSAASSALNVTVVGAPVAPTVASFTPIVTGVTSAAVSATQATAVTTAHAITLAGSATANTTVTIYDGSTKLGTAAVGASGAWSFATGQLATGAHQFTATDTDAYGDVSAASTVMTVTVQAPTPTPTPTVTSFSPDTGIVGDGVTDAHAITVSGAATANTTVTVFDGATKLGTATANATGAWSFTTGQLATGAHQFTATDTSTAGVVSAASSALNVTVVSAPSTPSLGAFSPDTGKIGDGITDAHTITLSGAATANTTVTVFDGAAKLGTATVGANGAWSFATGQLATGAHQFTATDTDAYGDVSAASSALKVTVAAAPTAPTVTSFSPDTGTVGNGVTDAHALTLSGAAAANTTVTVFDGATQLGTATANASGAWSLATSQLATGAHHFTATDTDAYGDVSAASSALNVTIVAAPSAPTLSSFSPDTSLTSGNITSSHTISLNGSAAANSTVTVFDGAADLGTTTVGSNGSWTFSASGLANGTHNFTATDTDAYGDVSSASSALTVQVDASGPSAPTFTDVARNPNGSVTLTGTSDPHSFVLIQGPNSALLGTATTASNGTWSFTTAPLSNNIHLFTISAEDVAGNTEPQLNFTAFVGTSHADILYGGPGYVMAGGGGADTFVFSPNFGQNVITDFQAKGAVHDVLQFNSTLFQNFAAVLSHAAQVGSDVVITGAQAGNEVTLLNVNKNALKAADFHLV
jgi:hypothetical protein